MPNDPKQSNPDGDRAQYTQLSPGSYDDPGRPTADDASETGDMHSVFGGNAQPQEVHDEKIVGAPDPTEPAQAAATETADTHPVFGNSVQPQDVHEKIVGAPDEPSDADE